MSKLIYVTLDLLYFLFQNQQVQYNQQPGQTYPPQQGAPAQYPLQGGPPGAHAQYPPQGASAQIPQGAPPGILYKQ